MTARPGLNAAKGHAGFFAVPVSERLKANSRQVGDCIEWTGALSFRGYGRIHSDGKMRRAHRVAFEIAKGPIPDGLVIDHVCRNRKCINPDHLRAVTQRQNSLENSKSSPAANAVKTHCLRGHPLAGANLIVNGTSRACRTCLKATQRRWVAKRRARK